MLSSVFAVIVVPIEASSVCDMAPVLASTSTVTDTSPTFSFRSIFAIWSISSENGFVEKTLNPAFVADTA